MRIIPFFDHLPFSHYTSTFTRSVLSQTPRTSQSEEIYVKQDDFFIRQGTIERAGPQMTFLVTKIWVEFNYLRNVHVAPLCISKLLKYQHLHSPFQRLLSPTSEAHSFFFSHIAAWFQEGEAHLFFVYFSSLSFPLWTEIKINAATNSQGSWMLREAAQLCCHLGTREPFPNTTASCVYVPCNNSLKPCIQTPLYPFIFAVQIDVRIRSLS